MTRMFYAACGLTVLGACASIGVVDNSSLGGYYDANGMFVAYCSAEQAPVIFTKEGFPFIDDQACIPAPEVLGVQIFNNPHSHPPKDDDNKEDDNNDDEIREDE